MISGVVLWEKKALGSKAQSSTRRHQSTSATEAKTPTRHLLETGVSPAQSPLQQLAGSPQPIAREKHRALETHSGSLLGTVLHLATAVLSRALQKRGEQAMHLRHLWGSAQPPLCLDQHHTL